MTALRSALFNLLFFIQTMILTLAGLVVMRIAPRQMLPMGRLWAALTLGILHLTCGIKVKVSGLEHLPESGPALIASQHQAAFDTIVWLSLVPRCCYVMKHEVMQIPVFGHVLGSLGMIAIDRSRGTAAMRLLLREADRAKAEGRQIIIFPEGTRALPGERLPLQPGIAAIAARTGLGVIPVLTDSGLYWRHGRLDKRPGTIRIGIQPPLAAGLDREELMRALTDIFENGVIPEPQTVDNSVG